MSPSNQIKNQDHVEDQSFELEDCPPITTSRNAKWYDSAFHNVRVIVGAGVLGLPYAMSELGWGPGVMVLILSWGITLFILWQMVEMHEMFEGQRFEKYHELGQAAFGRKLGLYIIVPLQLLVDTSACIIYMVIGGESLKRIHQLFIGEDKCTKMNIRHFILIYASSQFVLCLPKNINSIFSVTLVAAAMSVSYSTVSWLASVAKGANGSVEYGYEKRTTSVTLAFFSALGGVVFAYAGPNDYLEIQARIPSTPESPSKRPMWKGAIVAYIIVALCYFPVALVGYLTFGNAVEDNILSSLHDPKGLIILVNLFVLIHLLGNYQVHAAPVFDMIESAMIKKWHFSPTRVLRFTIRLNFVAATMGIAIAVPYFGVLQSFFGGFLLALTTYCIPCIIWLILKKPKRFSLSWCMNLICIFLGVLVMVLSLIGGLAKLVFQIQQDILPNSKCKIT